MRADDARRLLVDTWDEVTYRVRVAGMVLLRLPIVKCPCCGGAGGRISGYDEPEWEDCWFCADEWFLERELEQFFGRVHPLRWPWGMLVVKTGQVTFRGLFLCRIGRHDEDEYGYCRRCYQSARRGPHA